MLRRLTLSIHLLLIAISGTFTALLFLSLGQVLGNSYLFVALGLGLELAKAALLWHVRRKRRVATVSLVILLVAFSLVATSVSGFHAAEQATAIQRETNTRVAQLDTAIAQTKAQMQTLRKNLEALPIEWRITKNEYVAQLNETREDYLALVEKRNEIAGSQQTRDPGAARTWMAVAEAIGIPVKSLLLLFAILVALALEWALVATRPAREDQMADALRYRTEFPVGSIEGRAAELRQYAGVALADRAGARPMSLREASSQLGLSVSRVRSYLDKLKELGVIRTEGREAVQLCSKDEALARVDAHLLLAANAGAGRSPVIQWGNCESE